MSEKEFMYRVVDPAYRNVLKELLKKSRDFRDYYSYPLQQNNQNKLADDPVFIALMK